MGSGTTENPGQEDDRLRGVEGSRGRGRIRRVGYDRAGIDLIAEALGATVGLASFRLPGAAVYQILVAGANERPATLLTLWPSIRRVDAVGTGATAVFTGVVAVDLVEGVEVVFRRDGRETLIVAVGGKIIVRV